MSDPHDQLLGPFLLNTTIICFNISLLPDWVGKTDGNHIAINNKQQLQRAIVPCNSPLDQDPMSIYLVLFWNLIFTLMISIAIIGNCMVLWIVIRKYSHRQETLVRAACVCCPGTNCPLLTAFFLFSLLMLLFSQKELS